MASHWKPACFFYLDSVCLVIMYIQFGTSKELGFKLRICEHSFMSIRLTEFHGIWFLGIQSGSGSFRMISYILIKKNNFGDGDVR